MTYSIAAPYLNDDRYSTNLMNKTWKPDKPKDAAKGSSKTGKGKGSLKMDFDIGFYIQLTRQTNGALTDYYFDYAMIYVAYAIDARKDFPASICGVPVYMTLRGGGRIRGLLLAEGQDAPALNTVFGWFPVGADLGSIDFYGLFHINAYIALGVGVGTRGVLSVGGEGQLDVDIAYEPWQNGAGTLTFSLNVDIDILVIPLKFNVARYTLQLFKTPGYVDNDWLPAVTERSALLAANSLVRETGVSSGGELDRAENMSGWLPRDGMRLKSGLDGNVGAGLGEPVPPVTLQTGIYKHPQPELAALNDGKKLLLFVNDDLSRGDYDRTAVYYSVFDGEVWGPPVKLQDDGTADNDPYACVVGDMVLVCWSSADRVFGDTSPELSELLKCHDIYAQFFTMEGVPIGVPEQLTGTEGDYADTLPRIAYDEETGKIMVLYQKTDYETEDVEFDGDVLNIGDFLINSYSIVAYRLYADGGWQNEYGPEETSYLTYEAEHPEAPLDGQRFMDFGLPGVLSSPRVPELAVATHEGKAQIVYTLDIDQDPATKDDAELFMRVYDFAARTFTPPIRITDNLTPDGNPQVVKYDGDDYLYWNSDSRIVCLDIDAVMEFGLSEREADGTLYYEIEEGYDQYRQVFDEQNADAAESFTATLGEDGNVYLVWSELVQKVIEGPDGDVVKERQLFATMYDAQFREVGENEIGEPVYQGGWGHKWQLTRTPGEYNNEQAVAVDGDGIVTIVNRKYEIVEDGSTPDENDTKESDTSSLIARRFVPESTLTIADADIRLYPQYPRPGESVMLTIKAKNDGCLPSKQATFELNLIDSEDEMTPIDNVVIHSHIVSEGEVNASAYFTMPEDISKVRIRIRAWEEDMEDTATQKIYPIPVHEDLVLENQKGYFVSRDTMRLSATLLNLGNADAENVRLTIESYDDEAMTGALMSEDQNLPEPVTLKTMVFPIVRTTDKLEIDELIHVPDEAFGGDGDVEYSINIKELMIKELMDTGGGELEEVTVYTKTIVLHKDETLDTELSDIWVEAEALSLQPGTARRLDMQIIPPGAGSVYALHYRSSNPEIAEVDPSSGVITAKAPGTAQIVIEAVKYEHVYLQSADNRIYRPDGGIARFNPDGTPLDRLTEGGENEAELTKTVTVHVESSDTGDDDTAPETPPVARDTDTAQIGVGSTLVTNAAVAASLNELTKSGGPTRMLELTTAGDAVRFENAALKTLAGSDVPVKITMKEGEMILSPEVLKWIEAKASGDIGIIMNKAGDLDGRPVFELEIVAGNERITDFGGQEIAVKVAYTLREGEDGNAVVVYYIDDGQLHTVTNGEYRDGFVTFRTNHLSKFAVGYNKVAFSDADGWAESYIAYLAARGIVNGVGGGKFDPKRQVTRAEFVKMLAILSGETTPEDAAASFDDVARDAWYAPYVAWAAQHGYVLGVTEKTFAPNAPITREQMAAILARFAQAKKYSLRQADDTGAFADQADISTYAKEAVMLMKGAGIIAGRPGNVFAPQESATRAESVKMLATLLSLMIHR